LIVGALLGQMKLVKPLARKAAELFALSEVEEAMLNEAPYRRAPMPPTDPLIYRFHELVNDQRPGGEGVDRGGVRRRHHVGDRLRVRLRAGAAPEGRPRANHMSGKFLPYKYYGAEQGMPEYGFKETI